MIVKFNAPSITIKTDVQRIDGGGGTVDVQPLSVTENGTYTAPSGIAYSPVTVDVEGVVPAGAIEIEENGEYDVTQYASASVAVPQFEPSGTISIAENGTHDVKTFAVADVSVKQWDTEYMSALDGTMTVPTVPNGLTRIKPYAFYQPLRRVVLSDEYSQVEYVQDGTNNLYVATGVTGNCDIEFTAQADSTRSASQVLLCTTASATGTSYFGIMASTVWGSATSGGGGTNTTIYGGTKVSGTVTFDGNGNHGRINGATCSRSGTTTHTELTIFNNKNRTYRFGGKVWGVRVFQNGVLMRDLIPVTKNGVAGFYDVVEDEFLAPVGATLTAGAVVDIPCMLSADLAVSSIGEYAFANNALSALTLRADSVVPIGEHALDGTPIADGRGNIYVPSELVESYQAAYPDYASVISAITD